MSLVWTPPWQFVLDGNPPASSLLCVLANDAGRRQRLHQWRRMVRALRPTHCLG